MKFSHGIHPANAGPATVGNDCCRVRELEPELRRLGWSARVQHFGAEPMQIEARVSTSRAAKVVVASVSQPLQAIGRTRSDSVAIVMPTGTTRTLINDRKITPNDAIILPPRQSVVAQCGADANLLFIMLPARSLVLKRFLGQQYLARLQAGETLQVVRNSRESEHFRLSIVKVLRQTMHQRRHYFRVNAAKNADSRHLELSLSSDLEHPDDRIVWSAVNYIEANLTEAIPISALSEVSATSLSKLERTFRRKLNMTPSQYILARRLATARRRLAISEPGTTSVAAVALDSGFTHLGRFSGAYRRQFGELPKETLQVN